jgi:hypothetical protein
MQWLRSGAVSQHPRVECRLSQESHFGFFRTGPARSEFRAGPYATPPPLTWLLRRPFVTQPLRMALLMEMPAAPLRASPIIESSYDYAAC